MSQQGGQVLLVQPGVVVGFVGIVIEQVLLCQALGLAPRRPSQRLLVGAFLLEGRQFVLVQNLARLFVIVMVRFKGKGRVFEPIACQFQYLLSTRVGKAREIVPLSSNAPVVFGGRIKDNVGRPGGRRQLLLLLLL